MGYETMSHMHTMRMEAVLVLVRTSVAAVFDGWIGSGNDDS